MTTHNAEETKKIIESINQMQRAIFKFKKANGKEPTDSELANIIDKTPEQVAFIKKYVAELEKEEQQYNHLQKKHSKEDIKKARMIRKNKNLRRFIEDEQ